MGFTIASSVHEARAAAAGDQAALEKVQPIELKQVKSPDKSKLELPSFNPIYILVIIGIIFLLKYNPQPQQLTTIESTNLDMGHETTISGKIITKTINETGSVKIVLDDSFHNKQYNVIVSPDITADVQLVPGTQIRLTGNPLGQDTYTLNDKHKVQELTSIVNFDSLDNVYIKNGRATFQYGGNIAHLSMPGLQDGHYSQIIFAQDNKGQIQVLQSRPD